MDLLVLGQDLHLPEASSVHMKQVEFFFEQSRGDHLLTPLKGGQEKIVLSCAFFSFYKIHMEIQ